MPSTAQLAQQAAQVTHQSALDIFQSSLEKLPALKKVLPVPGQNGSMALLALTDASELFVTVPRSGEAPWTTPIRFGQPVVDFALYQDPDSLGVTLAIQAQVDALQVTYCTQVADPGSAIAWGVALESNNLTRLKIYDDPNGIASVQCLAIVHHPLPSRRESIVVAGANHQGLSIIGRFWADDQNDFSPGRYAEYFAPMGSTGLGPWRAIVPAWLPESAFVVLATNAIRFAIIPEGPGGYLREGVVNAGTAQITGIASSLSALTGEIGELFGVGDGIYRWTGVDLSNGWPPETLASMPSDPDAKARISVCVDTSPFNAMGRNLVAASDSAGFLHVGHEEDLTISYFIRAKVQSCGWMQASDGRHVLAIAMSAGGCDLLHRDTGVRGALAPWTRERVGWTGSGTALSWLCYRTAMTVLGDDGKPQPGAAVELSANWSCCVQVNGSFLHLRKGLPVEVTADGNGNIALIAPTDSLAAVNFLVSQQSGTTTTDTTIVPDRKVAARLAALRTRADLLNAKDRDGQPVFNAAMPIDMAVEFINQFREPLPRTKPWTGIGDGASDLWSLLMRMRYLDPKGFTTAENTGIFIDATGMPYLGAVLKAQLGQPIVFRSAFWPGTPKLQLAATSWVFLTILGLSTDRLVAWLGAPSANTSRSNPPTDADGEPRCFAFRGGTAVPRVD